MYLKMSSAQWRQYRLSLNVLKLGINSLRPRPNRRHFADDIFNCIFENENEWISPRISLKFVHKVRINNIPTLVQIMAWRRPGDKPLSEPMIVSLPTHICVTRPQWVNVPEADIKADSVLLRISMLSQVIFLACWWLILIPYIASKVYVELQ